MTLTREIYHYSGQEWWRDGDVLLEVWRPVCRQERVTSGRLAYRDYTNLVLSLFNQQSGK